MIKYGSDDDSLVCFSIFLRFFRSLYENLARNKPKIGVLGVKMAYFRSLGQLSGVGGFGGCPPTSAGSTRSLGVTKIHAATVFVSLIPPLIGGPHQGGPKRSAA